MNWFAPDSFKGHMPMLGKRHPVPVNLCCGWCEEQFTAVDVGVELNSGDALHVECFHRQLRGSIGHQLQRCSCFGGTMEDPPFLTKHNAARLGSWLAYCLSQPPGSEKEHAPWIGEVFDWDENPPKAGC